MKKTHINKTRKNSSESYRIYNEHKEPRMKTRWKRVGNDEKKKRGGAHHHRVEGDQSLLPATLFTPPRSVAGRQRSWLNTRKRKYVG